jgi:hypothetical protein
MSLLAAEKKVYEGFISRQQMEQKHKQSEINLRIAQSKIDKMKGNVRFRAQVKRRCSPANHPVCVMERREGGKSSVEWVNVEVSCQDFVISWIVILSG